MKRENEAPMPEPLETSLREAAPEKKRALERIWASLPEEAVIEPSTDEAWLDIERRINAVPSAPRPVLAGSRPARSRASRHGYGVAIAASLIVIFIAAGLWVLYRPTILETAAAEQRTVQLPDGSVVELNSATRLRVASRFENTLLGSSAARRVRLEGEAFFSVAKDPRPFIVETNDAFIRVAGTEFNVRARTSSTEAGTQVTLVEGEVVVTPRSDENIPVRLDAPGAAARVDPSAGTVSSSRSESSLDHVLAWRRQGFAFIDTPVDAILDELERRFSIRVNPRSGVDLGEPMNLFYSRGVTPEEILSDICVSQSCTYRQTSRGYTLTEPADRP